MNAAAAQCLMRMRKRTQLHPLSRMDDVHVESRAKPVLVVVLCGKRKCGKDHVATRLQQM